jgi:OPT family oligopeptide transporter
MVGAMLASALNKLGISLLGFPDSVRVAVNSMSAKLGVGFSLELLSLGSGMIIGIRVCASMLIGTLLSWVILPPILLDHGVVGANWDKNKVLLWVMWPATGMLVAGGMTALVLKWRSLVRTFQSLRGANVESGDFPMKWVIWGSLGSATLLVVIQKLILGTPVWHSVLAIILSLPLMLVALRVLGETNWGPISTMTNVMQALFGAIAPGNLRAGMVSSGITGSVAAESEGLIQDYKTGDMIGSTPKYLTYLQLMAVPVGALMLALIYPVLRDNYGFTGKDALDSPASRRWVGFATILSKGFSSLHPTALMALGIGAALGILFTVLEQKREIRNWVPSPTGIGIGMLISPAPIVTIFLGGCIEWIWRKISPESASKYVIPLASGLIAGEAIIAVVLAILAATGIWHSG